MIQDMYEEIFRTFYKFQTSQTYERLDVDQVVNREYVYACELKVLILHKRIKHQKVGQKQVINSCRTYEEYQLQDDSGKVFQDYDIIERPSHGFKRFVMCKYPDGEKKRSYLGDKMIQFLYPYGGKQTFQQYVGSQQFKIQWLRQRDQLEDREMKGEKVGALSPTMNNLLKARQYLSSQIRLRYMGLMRAKARQQRWDRQHGIRYTNEYAGHGRRKTTFVRQPYQYLNKQGRSPKKQQLKPARGLHHENFVADENGKLSINGQACRLIDTNVEAALEFEKQLLEEGYFDQHGIVNIAAQEFKKKAEEQALVLAPKEEDLCSTTIKKSLKRKIGGWLKNPAVVKALKLPPAPLDFLTWAFGLGRMLTVQEFQELQKSYKRQINYKKKLQKRNHKAQKREQRRQAMQEQRNKQQNQANYFEAMNMGAGPSQMPSWTQNQAGQPGYLYNKQQYLGYVNEYGNGNRDYSVMNNQSLGQAPNGQTQFNNQTGYDRANYNDYRHDMQYDNNQFQQNYYNQLQYNEPVHNKASQQRFYQQQQQYPSFQTRDKQQQQQLNSGPNQQNINMNIINDMDSGHHPRRPQPPFQNYNNAQQTTDYYSPRTIHQHDYSQNLHNEYGQNQPNTGQYRDAFLGSKHSSPPKRPRDDIGQFNTHNHFQQPPYKRWRSDNYDQYRQSSPVNQGINPVMYDQTPTTAAGDTNLSIRTSTNSQRVVQHSPRTPNPAHQPRTPTSPYEARADRSEFSRHVASPNPHRQRPTTDLRHTLDSRRAARGQQQPAQGHPQPITFPGSKRDLQTSGAPPSSAQAPRGQINTSADTTRAVSRVVSQSAMVGSDPPAMGEAQYSVKQLGSGVRAPKDRVPLPNRALGAGKPVGKRERGSGGEQGGNFRYKAKQQGMMQVQ